MTTIQQQIKLELGMVDRGKAKAANSDRAAREGGRVADTTYGKALTRQFLPELVTYIETYIAVGGATRFGKYRALLRMVDADKAALLALRGVFQDPFSSRPLPALAKLIGGMIEDEIKFSLFQEDHTEYYDTVIKDFEQRRVTNYRHRRRVLGFKANEKEVAWTAWTLDQRLHVGMILLDCILTSTDLIEKSMQRKGRKTTTVVNLTAEANDWIEKHKDHMALLSPEFMPCIIEPDDWTALDIGGYYTPSMRRRAPLVKVRSPIHKDILKSSDLSNVMNGANSLQQTAWRVNARVHAVAQEVWEKRLSIGMGSPDPIVIPSSPFVKIDKATFTDEQQSEFDVWRREASRLHTAEKDRIKKNFQIIRLMRAAQSYSGYDKFWYVYQTDFRGRFYAATAGFSPQGPDLGKALIEFAEPKMLGERGFYWLKVHFANLRGVDKVFNSERVKYTDEQQQEIIDCAADPLGRAKHLWVDADKQYGALAAIFELADAYTGDPATTPNRIAVALDGSCNGLQHYAAILRDRTGAEATNVCFTGKVADIYSDVGEVSADRVRACKETIDNAAALTAWRNFLGADGLPRKLAKKPVMTLPYGSTQRSCTDSVLDFLAAGDFEELFPVTTRMKASTFLTTHLWAGIGDVVTSAREAMTWIQKVAALMAKEGEPLIWVTPTGFPVYQGSNKIKVRRVHTQLGGNIKMQIGDFTDELDPRKQSSGAAPNYVHSMDASHLLMTVLRGIEIQAWAMIHDSYGTYACDTDALHIHIREAFIDLYHNQVPLANFKEQQECRTGITLPAPPAQGEFEITEVRDSPYFFG